MEIDSLLKQMFDKDGSDLHIKLGKPPLIRIHGHLENAEGFSEVTIDDQRKIILKITNDSLRKQFATSNELDFSYSIKGLSRFRVNMFKQRNNIGIVFRTIPYKIPPLDTLNLPPKAKDLILRPSGLLLVTGPTGSGKSTTLASLIDYVNSTCFKHIVTIEDPIEFVHNDKQCSMTQREVLIDTPSFSQGAMDVLRQDVDMVLIGEMRDIDTISTALLCAETGKLVLGTLHTTSAMQTVERILNVYPAEVQETVRAQFASVLVGIVCQALPRRIEGGRCAAFEILVANDSMKNLIRENKPQMMVSALETGKDYGMQTLDQHLSQLVLDEIISFEEGYAKCQNPKVFADVEKTLENKKKEKEKKEKMKSLDPFADFNPPTINTTAKKQ